MSIEINDIVPLDQFIASALQTVFSVTWTAELTTDVVVYARATGTTASDITDLIAPADYTVDKVGGSETIRVTFAVGRTAGDIVTITRDTSAQRDNLYINTNFTPTMLNGDLARSTYIEQQNQMYHDAVGPRYNVSDTFNPTVLSAAPNPGHIDRILPVLPALTLWAKNAGDTAIEAIAVPAGGIGPGDATFITQTPSTDLTAEQALSPLASGFMTSTTTTGVVATRLLEGTGGEIDITNLSGAGNPKWSLSAAMNAPGTFTIQGTTVINAIIDDDSFATASATSVPTSESSKAYMDSLIASSTPLTTKGDLLGFSTVNARLPVGSTDGQMLQVLAGATTGLAWSTASYPATATTSGQVLRSNGTNYLESTATFADTYAASSILYSNGVNAVQGLATANSATLVTSATGVPVMSGPLANGQLLIGSTGATPVAANLTAGAGISISESAGGITIAGTASSIGWTEVTGTSQSATVDSGYVTNNAGLVTITLPATAAFGTMLSIIGKGAGGWLLAQNAGQNIQVGAVSSTAGAGGSVASTNQFDSIDLLCTEADTTWTTQGGIQGSLTIV